MRLRLRFTDNWSLRRGLVLTDTPRPDCPDCQGRGGWIDYVADGPSGEDGYAEDIPCGCWHESRRWPLLLLPRLPRWIRRLLGKKPTDPWGYSDEAPF